MPEHLVLPGSRRQRAFGIRLVQEVAKRVDGARSAPQWRDVEQTLALVSPGIRKSLRSAHEPNGLAGYFGHAAATRFPSRHFAGRPAESLPRRDELIAEADRIRKGCWELFGHDVMLPPETMHWNVHPLSGRLTSDERWHRLRYMNGETGGDVKWIWELNRHEHLVRLAQAYHLTGREEYATLVGRLLSRWMAQNPPGIGVNWASSLEVAIRAVAWCWIWHLTHRSSVWTPDRFAELLWHLWHHARHIERFDSIHHSPNTHLTGEAIGLLYVAACFPELEASDRWIRRAVTTLDTEIDHQILADGMHFERCTGYHRYTLEFYLHAALLARYVSPGAVRRFEQAIQLLASVSHALRRPDGTWPVLGDEDGGRLLRLGMSDHVDHAPLLAATLSAEPDAESAVDRRAFDDAWWLLDREQWSILDASARSRQRGPSSRALRDAGYHLICEGTATDAWYCLVDGGPHGGDRTGHAHSDCGHIEIARGRRLLVADPGCSSYTVDAARRAWYRSEQAHACVSVEGAPMAIPTGPFSWDEVSEAPAVTTFAVAEAWIVDLHQQRLMPEGKEFAHRRQVALVRGLGVIVCDWLTGGEGRSVELSWPLAASPEDVRIDGEYLVFADTVMTWCTSSPMTKLEVDVHPAVRSPAYGQEVPSSRLAFRLPHERPRTFGIATCFARAGDVLLPSAVSGAGMVFTFPGDSQELVFSPDTPPTVRQAHVESC